LGVRVNVRVIDRVGVKVGGRFRSTVRIRGIVGIRVRVDIIGVCEGCLILSLR
jgi:hypothetical protein